MNLFSPFGRFFASLAPPPPPTINIAPLEPEPAPIAAEPEIPATERFWIVWNPRHPKAPRVKHVRKVDAENAAKWMLRRRQNRNEVLYVMQASSVWAVQGEQPKGWFY